MTSDSFYLTLPSNSSMIYFPENKTANFCTKLPRSIKLEGEWMVGIVEFLYPCTMFTVQNPENIMYITKRMNVPGDKVNESTVSYKTQIPPHTYDSIDDIVSVCNLKETFKLRYDKILKNITLTHDDKKLISLKFSPKLSLQLGFDPDTNIITKKKSKFPPNLYLGLPSQMFIYCDIIEPQMVGDVICPLLRVIPIDTIKYTYGSNKTHIFSPPHYVPVMRREFDTIEIDIRTNTGSNVPFQFGTTCVKLHFIRKQ